MHMITYGMIKVPTFSDAAIAFPTSGSFGTSIPRYKDIPEEFKRNFNLKWTRLFQDCFFNRNMKHDRLGLLPRDGVVAKDAWTALCVLMGVRDIKHEHKEAAWAYLAAQWFVDCRWETDKLVPFDDAELEAGWVKSCTQ